MPSFGPTSSENLSTAKDQFIRLFTRVVQVFDCAVLVGHRAKDAQNHAFEAKTSTKKWPNSKHNALPSKAVDVVPWPIPTHWGDLDSEDPARRDRAWKERVKFYELAAIVRYEAVRLDIKIRWGGDWDGDGDYNDQTFDDLVHFELVE